MVNAATPPTNSVPTTPPPVPPFGASDPGQSPSKSLRIRWSNWMENRFGKLALPVSALAGAALLGSAGMLLHPVAGAVGAATGALLGGVLFLAG